MPHTLTLTPDWDIFVDGSGNIAESVDGYAVAQNVANAVRLFTDDAYFDRRRGIPHFDIELGHVPPLSVLRSRIVSAAKGVDGVASAVVEFDPYDGRTLSGDIKLTLTDGGTANVGF